MSVVFWPITALWRLLAFVIKLTCRFVGIVVGLVLMIVGVILTATFVGAIVGIPLIALGLLLIARGLF
jgi:hypothetical protein